MRWAEEEDGEGEKGHKRVHSEQRGVAGGICCSPHIASNVISLAASRCRGCRHRRGLPMLDDWYLMTFTQPSLR